MKAVDVIMLVAGITVMLLMFAGMFLLTPRGSVEVGEEGSEGQGSELSPVHAPVGPA